MVCRPEEIGTVLARIVTDAVVVTDLVAELVALAGAERENTVAATQSVFHHPIAVLAACMVNHRGLEHLRLLLRLHARTGHTEIGEVDAHAEGRFSGVLPHIAAVDIAGDRALLVVDGARSHHHARQRHVFVVRRDHARRRNGLEIIRRRLGRMATEPMAVVIHLGRGQHAESNALHHQLGRGSKLDGRALQNAAAILVVRDAQLEARRHPIPGQYGGPGATRIDIVGAAVGGGVVRAENFIRMAQRQDALADPIDRDAHLHLRDLAE